MNKNSLMLLLTGSLALSSATSQANALESWVSTYWPKLVDEAKTLQSEGFDFSSLGSLASMAMEATQSLKGVFKGTARATIAQTVFVAAAKAALPDKYEHWIIPLLDSPVAAAMIEAAFRRVYGSKDEQSQDEGKADAVIDAPELPEAGVE